MVVFSEIKYETDTVAEQSVELIQQNGIQVKVDHITIVDYNFVSTL